MLDENISALIGDIYEGPRNSGAWQRVLNGLLDRTGSRFIMVSAVDLRRREYSQAYWHGADDARFLDGVRDYEADLYRTDPTLEFASRNPNAGFVTMATAIADSGVAPADHPYLRWTNEVLGVGHSMVRYTAPQDDRTVGISLHPPRARITHDAAEIRLFLMLFEHIERSMRLAARPPDFEHPHEARLLVDSRGLVRETSGGARAMFARPDGLRIERGRLHAARPQDTARIDALIMAAVRAISHGGVGGGITVPRPLGRRDWLVLVSPLPQTHEPFASFGPAAVIRIVDPETGAPPGSGANWMRMFGLTPTEARLAQTLMEDDGDLRTTAERLGMRISTARVHLRHIFDKTGARGQAPLMRLLQRIEG